MNNNKYNVSKNVGSFASNQAARYKIARLYMAFSASSSPVTRILLISKDTDHISPLSALTISISNLYVLLHRSSCSTRHPSSSTKFRHP